MEFKLRFNEADPSEALGCECCGYETGLAEFRPNIGPRTEPYLFCEICSSTFLSHCVQYTSLHGQSHHLWSSIGWIANRLLEAIEGVKAPEVPI